MKIHKKLLWVLLAMSTLIVSCSKSADPLEPIDQYPPTPIPIPTPNPPTPNPPTPNPPTPSVFAEDSSLFLGNPSNATDNINNYTNFLFDERYYAVSYNRERATANWSSWHVKSSDYGSVSRADDFRANPNMPSGWYAPDYFSYTGSGFDRGHLCPSADRTATVAANSSTFLMTNIIPQAPNNNQAVWANLETYCRTLVNQGNELYIVAGAFGEGGTGNNGYATGINNDSITVPATLWKVIVVIREGTDDLNRIDLHTRVIAVMMPNENGLSTNWKNFRVSVDAIEAATGYDFLSRVNSYIQDYLEMQVDDL